MPESTVSRDEQKQVDEERLGRVVSVGLPIATAVTAVGVGVAMGPATSVLVVAAGLLLGVIALVWTSLRILSGDVSLPPELAALDASARGVDALSGRKNMLLRALKDLESERALGKLEEEDFELMAQSYRAELKTLLKRIDEMLAPHRAKAVALADDHLKKVGLAGATETERGRADTTEAEAAPAIADVTRIPCPKCGESNEAGSKFCKECATRLVSEPTTESTKTTDDA